MAVRAAVLVVEDEIFVRVMAADALAEAGFATVEAGNAEEAIALLEARDDIRIVFTDIRMPGAFDGLELVARVRRRWPGLPVVLTSGHTGRGETPIPAGVPFLQKPYRAATLIATLAAQLG